MEQMNSKLFCDLYSKSRTYLCCCRPKIELIKCKTFNEFQGQKIETPHCEMFFIYRDEGLHSSSSSEGKPALGLDAESLNIIFMSKCIWREFPAKVPHANPNHGYKLW